MKEGDIVLAPLPQSNGQGKYRPAVLLRLMPGLGDLLVCGISTQLRQQVIDFDEIIDPSQVSISGERHQRLFTTLSEHLLPSGKNP